MKQKIILFLSTSIPFAAFLSLLSWWNHPNVYYIIYISIFFGLIVTIPLSIFQWIVLKRKGVKQSSIKVVNSTEFIVEGTKEEVFKLCKNSISNVKKCEIKQSDIEAGTIEAKANMTWLTWGDIITFQINEIEINKYYVAVVSRPMVKTTVIDYGKNLDNITRIINFFKSNKYLNVQQKN